MALLLTFSRFRPSRSAIAWSLGAWLLLACIQAGAESPNVVWMRRRIADLQEFGATGGATDRILTYSSSRDGGVMIHDATTGSVLRLLRAFNYAHCGAALSPDGNGRIIAHSAITSGDKNR